MINQLVDLVPASFGISHAFVNAIPEDGRLTAKHKKPQDPFEIIDVRSPLYDIEGEFNILVDGLRKLFVEFTNHYRAMAENGVSINIHVERASNAKGGMMSAINIAMILLALIVPNAKICFGTDYMQVQCINWLFWQIMERLEDTPEWWERFKYLPNISPFYCNEYNEALQIMMQVGMHCIDSERYPLPQEVKEESGTSR